MKRWIVILITALAAMLAVDVCAQEPQRGVKISGGADIVSGYVWRGVWESGACIQPVMTLSAGNFSATAWGSVDFAATSYKEMDLTLAYALGPVTFSLADLYWEGGAGDRSTISRNYFRFGADSPHRVEAGVAWCISPEAPVTLAWNTVLFGALHRENRRHESRRRRRSVECRRHVRHRPRLLRTERFRQRSEELGDIEVHAVGNLHLPELEPGGGGRQFHGRHIIEDVVWTRKAAFNGFWS